MMINIDGFREQFAKYLFSGILDDHPGLRIGWFEGGIAWVPWALQDAEHLVASYQHMFNRPLEHDVRYYWDTHMSASFMVDPLGLQLIDQIGVDRVMWSSDYPHNESTFGYSEKSLAAVVEAVGAEARGADRQRQHHPILRPVEALSMTSTLRSWPHQRLRSTSRRRPISLGCVARPARGCGRRWPTAAWMPWSCSETTASSTPPA